MTLRATNGRPARVLIYSESLALGGSERFLRDLVVGLDSDRFAPSLLVSAGSPVAAFVAAAAPHVAIDEVDVGYFYSAKTSSSSLFRHVGKVRAARNGADGRRALERGVPPSHHVFGVSIRTAQSPMSYVRLRAAIKRLRPDVLHVNNGGFPAARSAILAARAARHERVPAVVHFVHGYPDARLRPRRLEALRDRAADRNVTLWATAAHGCAEALSRMRDIPSARIRAVPLGIEPYSGASPCNGGSPLVELELSPNLPTISVVGSLLERKGHATALRAVAELARGGRPVQLLVVGTGPAQLALEALSRQLGIEARVRFLGWRDDVDGLLRTSGALLMPSTGPELLPYAIKDAMARGLPVVASAVGAVPELVEDEVTGLLFAPADHVAAASALARLLDDPKLSATLALNARDRVEREFSIRAMLDAMSDVYEEALRPSGGGR